MIKKAKATKKYEKPKEKKQEFSPKMKKCRKLNTVICSCSVVYGVCTACGTV